MAWFKFSKDFDFRPSKMSIVAYKKDQHVNIKRDAIDAALAAKAGEETDHGPQRGDATDGSQPVRPKKVKDGVETVAVPRVNG